MSNKSLCDFEVDGELKGTSLDINGAADIAGNLTMTNHTLTANRVDASEFRLDTLGDAITFYGGGQLQHSISAKDASGNAADDLRINSYGAVYINLDSNSNNSSTADFVIGRHGDATGTITQDLLSLSGENGKLTVNGEVEATSLDINGNADISGYTTFGNSVVINTSSDGKMTLQTPSGDSSDWNYINFKGRDGTRDAYFGTTNDGTPSWYRDDGGANITLQDGYVNSNKRLNVVGELEATSLDINGNADISGNLTGVNAFTASGKIQGAELEGTSLDINGNADISGNLTGVDAFTASGKIQGAELEGTSLDINGRVDFQTISTSGDGTVVRGGFLNPAAEASMVHIPHLINDLAGFQKWSNSTITVTGLYKTRGGSSGSYSYSNAVAASDFSGGQAFDAHSSTAGSWYSDNGADGSTAGVGVITLEWPNELTYSAWAGIVFGSGSFTAPRVKIEAYQTDAGWQTLCDISDNSSNVVLRQISGNSGGGQATKKLRYTLGGSVNNSYFRIHTLYAANYRAGDNSLNNTSTAHTQGVNFLEKYKDGYLHGHLYPGADDTYDLGSNSYQWRNGYFDGSVICDGASVDGNITVTGDANITGSITNATWNGDTIAASKIATLNQNTTGDAGSVDGRHYQDHYGVGYKYDITVNGDAATYYPVVIDGTWAYASNVQIQRGYGETAPSSWNTSTHKGGLTLQYQVIGEDGWGGYPTDVKVNQAAEIYSRVLGGLDFTAHTMKHVVWLRGGTALYHVYCKSALTITVNDSTSASNYVAGSSPNAWYSYDHANNSYDVEVAQRTQSQADTAVITEIYDNMPVKYGNTKTNGNLNDLQPTRFFVDSSATQTITGAKTFSALASFTMDGNTITGIDDSGEFTDNDAHIMTSAGINDRFALINASTTGNAATATALTSGDKTISGNVTVSGIVLDGNTITGIDNDSEFTSNDNHIMTSLAISRKIADNDNSFLTSVPNHSGGLITSGTVAAARVATLNQNTTGNAGTVTNGVYTTGNQGVAGVKTFSSQILGQKHAIISNSSFINRTHTQFNSDNEGGAKVYIGSNNFGWNDARDYATNLVLVSDPVLDQNDQHNGVIAPFAFSRIFLKSQIRLNGQTGTMQVRLYKMARASGVLTTDLALTEIGSGSVSCVANRTTTLDVTGTGAVAEGDLIFVGFGKTTTSDQGQKPRINYTLTGTIS